MNLLYWFVQWVFHLKTCVGITTYLCHRVLNLLKCSEIKTTFCIACTWEINFFWTVTYPLSLWMYWLYLHIVNNLAWSFWWLFIPEVKLGCIWLDVLGILNVSRWVKEYKILVDDMITLLWYLTRIWLNISRKFLLKKKRQN